MELEELRQEVRRLEARVRASHRDLQAQADKAELQRRFAAAAQARPVWLCSLSASLYTVQCKVADIAHALTFANATACLEGQACLC